MNEHPILYSKQMILAKLAGRKTVTRRPVKGNYEFNNEPKRYKYHGFNNKGAVLFEDLHQDKIKPWVQPIDCPYGQPGDRLWTKENFKIEYGITLHQTNQLAVKYKADQHLLKPVLTDKEIKKWQQWKYPFRPHSKLHMFRSLSRFLDEITEISVERVQDITEKEALKEGIYLDKELKKYVAGPDAFCLANSPKRSFKMLWQSMYKGIEFDYHTNPWVWVVRYQPMAVNEAENQNFQ